jgi:hypothetical protein
MTSEIFSTEEFFAPTPTDLVDNLLGRYKATRQAIESMAMLMRDPGNQVAVECFLRGNRDRNQYIPPVGNIFSLEGALANLSARYWQQALQLTDVFEFMPAERREEWNDSIRDMKTPEFKEDTVRSTLVNLLNSRQRFFSERVDGIFKILSGDHVTNRPEGFGKRMILSGVFDQWGHSNYKMANYISDLRQVIAKFMGRGEPSYQLTSKALEESRAVPGEWLTIDAGALRIRSYLKGTSHLEVHPDMAWRLNCILAHLYPMAIPSEFRTKPKKKIKDFVMIDRPLPFAVLDDLLNLEIERHQPFRREKWSEPVEPVTTNPFNRRFRGSESDKIVRSESERVMESIGGTKMWKNAFSWWEFDYNPREVISKIIASGCVPDDKSHQFYPTPSELAEYCVSLADIQPGHKCLEPSAGHGGIAELMPADQTICVEISPLKCQVLDSKGLRVYEADFLKWSQNAGACGCFDRIVMNPPFSDGRAQLHLEAAASLTKIGSKIIAILPAGMRNKTMLPDDWDCNWSEPRTGEFSGTNISVVILVAERQWKE